MKNLFLILVILIFPVNASSNKTIKSSLPECSSKKPEDLHFCFAESGHYTGEWMNGSYHGQGTIEYQNGEIYIGEFANGKMHGHGTYIWEGGNSFTGNWLNGMYTDGTYKFKDGDTYKGTWNQKEGVGKGVFSFSDGTIMYEGTINERGVFHGYGTFNYDNGASYTGNWVNGNRHGLGTLKYADGKSNYVGSFKNNLRHGLGITTKSEEKERGYYMNDIFVSTICEGMGLKTGSETFGQCILKLIDEINGDTVEVTNDD